MRKTFTINRNDANATVIAEAEKMNSVQEPPSIQRLSSVKQNMAGTDDFFMADTCDEFDNRPAVPPEVLQIESYVMTLQTRRNEVVLPHPSDSDSDKESDSEYEPDEKASSEEDSSADELSDDADHQYSMSDSGYDTEERDGNSWTPSRRRAISKRVCGGSADHPEDDECDKGPEAAVSSSSAGVASSSSIAAAAIEKNHAFTMKISVRTVQQARNLEHFKETTWSKHEMTKFKETVNDYIQNNKSKFSKVAATDLLDPKARHRVIKFDMMNVDWAEISACCGRLPLPVTHMLKDVTVMLKRRVDILGQAHKSGDENTRQCVLDYVRNLSPDPDDPQVKSKTSRIVMLDGYRCCISCFRAAMGICRSTLYDIRGKCVQGEFVATDVRKARHLIAGRKPAELRMKVAAELINMAEFSERYPTTEGGKTKEYYAFPFAYRQQLFDAVNLKLNPTQDKSKDISQSTMRDAIRMLQNEHDVVISCLKVKKFMQCSACFTLDRTQRAQTTRVAKAEIMKKKSMHLNQVNLQRYDFARRRDFAM